MRRRVGRRPHVRSCRCSLAMTRVHWGVGPHTHTQNTPAGRRCLAGRGEGKLSLRAEEGAGRGPARLLLVHSAE